MGTVIVQERNLGDMVRTLRQFDGWRCLWRVPVAIGTYALIRGLPVLAAIAIAVFVVNGRVAEAAVAAVIALLFDEAGKKLRHHFPWRAAVANRLWIYEKPNPDTEVPVLFRPADVNDARLALRRAKFTPSDYSLSLGIPPDDAPELSCKVIVHEAKRWAQSSSDAHRSERIAQVLERAGIRARVGGIDVPMSAAATSLA